MLRQKSWSIHVGVIVLFALLVPFGAGTVLAQQYQSSNFSVDEFFVGPGGGLDSASTSYSARATLGDLGIGNSTSANYQAYGGYTTTNDPYLELSVNTSNVSLGVLTDTSTGSGTAEFTVRSYLASGYVISYEGTTLTNSAGATIDALTTPTGSSQGTEQFGINLVANTTPAVGAAALQVPDATFSFGTVAAGYNTADQFQFNNGDTIATSASSTGQTTYTVSYMANVTGITGAGLYEATQAIVATSTF